MSADCRPIENLFFPWSLAMDKKRYRQLRTKGLPALYAFVAAKFPNESEYNRLMARGLVICLQDGQLTIQPYPVVYRRKLRFGADVLWAR